MAVQLARNPTLSTVVKVQRVLEDAQEPITRYEIHKRLGGSVNYPVLESVLNYFAQMRLIVDEGKKGSVLWVHNTHAKAAKLFLSSRRVA
ncbi:MAG: hypothetical protein WDA16_02810 [Candidatus Thermoplasmatota archaeon]